MAWIICFQLEVYQNSVKIIIKIIIIDFSLTRILAFRPYSACHFYSIKVIFIA